MKDLQSPYTVKSKGVNLRCYTPCIAIYHIFSKMIQCLPKYEYFIFLVQSSQLICQCIDEFYAPSASSSPQMWVRVSSNLLIFCAFRLILQLFWPPVVMTVRLIYIVRHLMLWLEKSVLASMLHATEALCIQIFMLLLLETLWTFHKYLKTVICCQSWAGTTHELVIFDRCNITSPLNELLNLSS